MTLVKRKRERRKREGKRAKKTLKEGDTNVVVSGNRVRILLQNNLKIVLQIPTRLFLEPRWYLPSVFNFKIFMPYHRGSRVNCAGIVVLNFKNVTTLFLIAVLS